MIIINNCPHSMQTDYNLSYQNPVTISLISVQYKHTHNHHHLYLSTWFEETTQTFPQNTTHNHRFTSRFYFQYLVTSRLGQVRPHPKVLFWCTGQIPSSLTLLTTFCPHCFITLQMTWGLCEANRGVPDNWVEYAAAASTQEPILHHFPCTLLMWGAVWHTGTIACLWLQEILTLNQMFWQLL